MALTVTTVRRTVYGNRRVVIADVTFDSSYLTGGESLTPSDLGLTAVDRIDAGVSTGGYVIVYDHTNSKLMAFQGDNTNAAAAPLIQVPNATNLSAVSVRVDAIGN